jgi:hypothetical protein
MARTQTKRSIEEVARDAVLAGIVAAIFGGLLAVASASVAMPEMAFVVGWGASFYYLYRKSGPAAIIRHGLYIVTFLILLRFVLGGMYFALQSPEDVMGGIWGVIILTVLLLIILATIANMKDLDIDIY